MMDEDKVLEFEEITLNLNKMDAFMEKVKGIVYEFELTPSEMILAFASIIGSLSTD